MRRTVDAFTRTTLPLTCICRNWKWNIIYSNFNTAALRPRHIPAVTVIVYGGRALLAVVGVAVLDPEDVRGGKRDEPSETGASTTWPHPIVRSGITRPVIVSSCLMSLADSGHVSGKRRESWELWKLGECEADLQGKWSGHKAWLLLCHWICPARVHLMHRVSLRRYG